MTSFRDARRMKPHREVTVTGRRVVLVIALEVMVVGGAFAGGYLLRGDPPHAPRPAALKAVIDPLRQLDADDKRVDYTYHQVLTRPRQRVSAPLTEVAAVGTAAVAVVVAAPKVRPLPRAVAQRPRREEVDEGGSDEIRRLETRVRNLAASSARTKAARKVEGARAASTDDELSEAMDPARAPNTRGEE